MQTRQEHWEAVKKMQSDRKHWQAIQLQLKQKHWEMRKRTATQAERLRSNEQQK